MDWARWPDYLAWCASRPNATELRDEARRRVDEGGGRWSVRRQVDQRNGTTWFPFFEQLYRQTIRGAADVLSPLACRSRDEVRVLPWHGDDPAAFASRGTAVIEGFPGLAIASLGLSSTGYKGPGASRKDRRQTIVEALVEAALPIPPDVAARAVEDTEGDALDALTLLLSARRAAGRSAEEWGRQKAVADGWRIEGWFFD